EYPHTGLWMTRLHPPLLDGEEPHGRRAVSAVASPVHLRFLDSYLSESEADVDIGCSTPGDQHCLACRGCAATNPVKLTVVGAAKQPEKDLPDRKPGLLQTLQLKYPALACAATHPMCTNFHV